MEVAVFLGQFAESLMMSPQRRAMALQRVSELEQRLKPLLPYVTRLRPFGSVWRGTALAEEIYPNADVDCLLCMKFGVDAERFPNVPPETAEALLLEEVRTALVATGITSNVSIDYHWIVLNVGDIRFELGIGGEGEWENKDIFIMNHRDSEWIQRYTAKDLRDRYGGNTVRPASDVEDERVLDSLLSAEPFAIDYSILEDEFTQKLVTWMVVLLKYWNLVYRVGLPSFVLEQNVMEFLKTRARGQPADNVFVVLSGFLRDEGNYDAELLHTFPSFLLLRDMLRYAEVRVNLSRHEDAAALLSAFFPRPQEYRQFGPYLGQGIDGVRARVETLNSEFDKSRTWKAWQRLKGK